MPLYQEMQTTTRELLTEFNQGTLTLVRMVSVGGPMYDPGAPTESTYNLVGTTRGVATEYVNGTSVLSSDLQATIAVPTAVVPVISDKLRVDGVDHAIVGIKTIPSSGTTVAIILVYR